MLYTIAFDISQYFFLETLILRDQHHFLRQLKEVTFSQHQCDAAQHCCTSTRKKVNMTATRLESRLEYICAHTPFVQCRTWLYSSKISRLKSQGFLLDFLEILSSIFFQSSQPWREKVGIRPLVDDISPSIDLCDVSQE